MNSRTVTSVHSGESMLRQRMDAFLRDQYALSGVSVFVQTVIGCCLYLFDRVSTPGYLCVLLSMGSAGAFYAAASFLQRRADPEKGVLKTYLGAAGEKAAAVLLAVCLLMDAQLASFSLCAVMSEVLPDVSTLLVALAVFLLTAFAIGGRDQYALPRLSRILRWVLILFLLWPLFRALPQGNRGHLFPLLGQGAGSIFSGALWMTGCAAGAVYPWLLPKGAPEEKMMREGKKKGIGSLLGGGLFGCVFALAAAFLLPFYALARPETLGWRLMIFGTLSPSLIGWSLNVWAILFFLLLGMSAGVTRAASLLSAAAEKSASSPFLLTFLLFLQLPLAALHTDDAALVLVMLSPLRGTVTAGLLGLMLLCSALKKTMGKTK